MSWGRARWVGVVLVLDIAKKVLLPSSRRALFSVAIKSANRGGCGDDDHSHTNLLARINCVARETFAHPAQIA